MALGSPLSVRIRLSAGPRFPAAILRARESARSVGDEAEPAAAAITGVRGAAASRASALCARPQKHLS